jgi:signal transduction protein with GAF and PtsI domain
MNSTCTNDQQGDPDGSHDSRLCETERPPGDPLGACILNGLGVDELSMSAQVIAAVKATLRSDSFSAMQLLAQRALTAGSADEVHAL